MKTCAIVNVIESSIARDSQFVLPIHCGTEIGVASTKAFLGQILILYILALKLGSLRGDVEKKELFEKLKIQILIYRKSIFCVKQLSYTQRW